MRTTIQLDDDVSAAIARLRKSRDIGLSAAINELIRQGLRTASVQRRFVQRTAPMGIRIDVTNVGEALELLEGAASR